MRAFTKQCHFAIANALSASEENFNVQEASWTTTPRNVSLRCYAKERMFFECTSLQNGRYAHIASDENSAKRKPELPKKVPNLAETLKSDKFAEKRSVGQAFCVGEFFDVFSGTQSQTLVFSPCLVRFIGELT